MSRGGERRCHPRGPRDGLTAASMSVSRLARRTLNGQQWAAMGSSDAESTPGEAPNNAHANRIRASGRVAQWESARFTRERSQVRNPPRPSRSCLQISGYCRCIVSRMGARSRPIASFVGLNSCHLDSARMLAKPRLGVFAWLVERSLGACATGVLRSRTPESSNSGVSLATQGAPPFRAFRVSGRVGHEYPRGGESRGFASRPRGGLAAPWERCRR